ncbi:gliding motility-associated C-terminal domain-containing protein [Tenacibaculum finnmarkense]|uniref:T9SS type B sorting domain-containing protein n=1 Tax=Tenacibaculum finnmarkense TaxID=2781243 RepID=UPI001E4AD3C5|nr:gliding motility-associated C-terminal domain-containing protein [Tenacibaculum finnmarkense]MCD8422670.1 gliding motility-associated C-terminal domain-containing protein [Tenacibaculum finnmarkense genomovar ulcerans]MCG8238673.1 gliding motility-associated C-terminal domain-containing protein [Tenacibaculum finnmarkense genomovar ulcerans]
MKIIKSTYILLGIFLFFMSTSIVSQTLLKPELKFTSACDDTTSTDYTVTFKYKTSTFATDNTFTIELSDANGTWNSPVNLATVATENDTFTFSRTFQLPENTFGKNYKIRLVATSPAMTSPDSESFEAYKKLNGTLILNDFEDVVLCDGATTELTLNTDQQGAYTWYRDGSIITTTTDPFLEVSASGKYQVKIDYGACGFKDSTLIDVVTFSETDAQINSLDVVEICGDEAHTFQANVTDTSYTYTWFLDNQEVQSSNSSTYTTPTVGQLGVYSLEIDTGVCVTTSNNVSLNQKNAPSFTITENTPLASVLLPGEAKDISITVNNAANFEVEWYKDDKRLFGVDGTSLNVNQPGTYIANVVETATGLCSSGLSSQPIRLLSVKRFEPVMITDDNYESCTATGVDLKLQQVNVIAQDDNEYVLTSEQLELLNYQWILDGVNIVNATDNKLTRSSYTQNGIYTLGISAGHLNNVSSSELDIKLIAKPAVVTSEPSSNSLCPGGIITYTIKDVVDGYTYQWFKNDDQTALGTDVAEFVVNEIGTYTLKMTGFGCEKIIETLEVVLFDAAAIVVTPSEKVVLKEGESTAITAAGAESYMWYEGENTDGMLLSTSETLEVTSLGFYTVVATAGACGIEKTIEVIAQDDQVIVPNIVTPNADGVNDTWSISNKYAFQPTVSVQLYNANGKEIFKTNDYQNDWPFESLGNQRVFYYKIIKENILIKAGTISVLD